MIDRVLLSAFVVGCITFAGAPALAQTVPGCNPQVLDAMVKKNDALVGYDAAVIQETFDKPDSVLAMTCFNRAAGLDATEAGKIFSEDFMVALKDIVEPWLTAFYDEFQDAAGQDPATGYMPTAYSAGVTLDPSGAGGAASQCDFVHEFWSGVGAAPPPATPSYKNKGVQLKIPFITLDMLRGASAIPAAGAGAAGADFLQKWGAGLAGTGQIDTALDDAGNPGNVKADLDAALTLLPVPTMPAAGFTTQNTVCAVLVQAGITCP